MTIEELLRRGTIPIINENDTVSVDELKFGDNDMLSALVANLVKAGKLIIVTDMDGLYTDDPRKNAQAKRIDRLEQITDEVLQFAGGTGSTVGTGGMRSKLEAAQIAVLGGVPVFVGKADAPGDLTAAFEGGGKGTYVETSRQHSLSIKKQWVGFHSEPRGRIIVDAGAEQAVLSGGKSLLPAGVREVEGDFVAGDVVEVRGNEGRTIGRGIVNYAADQLRSVIGLSSEEAGKRVEVQRIEVIHRDEWIALTNV